MRLFVHGFLDEGLELAICRQAIIEFKPQAPGRLLGLGLELRILDLGEIDQPAIIAEVIIAQFGMAIETAWSM